jgi:hypothetical protein
VVSEERIFMWISLRVLCWAKFGCGGHLGRRAEPLDTFFEENHLGGHLGWKSGSSDTILEGGNPRTIPPKFGCNWPSGFWGED